MRAFFQIGFGRFRGRSVSLVLGFLLLLTACKGPKPTFEARDQERQRRAFSSVEPRTLDPTFLQPRTDPYRIGIGDLLEIEIAGIAGSRAETFVTPDGRVYFDLAGGVPADGLTVHALSDALENALRHDYTSPSVNVTLREVNSRRVWILGRVNKPGLYPLKHPTTLLEAISMAGGLFTSRFSGSTEELADLGNSFVIREGEILPVDFTALLREGDFSQNIYLRDGDYIYLPSALSQSLFILGQVVQPQAVGYSDGLSLVGALAHAKGPTSSANLSQVVIIRGDAQKPEVAVVNLKAILAGQEPDVYLRPLDTVYVPKDRFEKIEEYFWAIWDTAARTIAVNEGARSVVTSGDATSPIVIPIGP